MNSPLHYGSKRLSFGPSDRARGTGDLDMTETLQIALLWTVFAASHLSLSSLRFRPRLVERLGESRFLGMYSLVAALTFVPVVWVYAASKHAGPFLGYGSGIPGLRYAMIAGGVVSFGLIVGGLLDRSPAFPGQSGSEVRGVLRVTRHPLFMGLGLLAFLHLFAARIHTSDLAFFGGAVAFSLVGCWHQDRRKLTTEGPEFAQFVERTSFLPFARGGFTGLLERPAPFLIGLALGALLRWFHPILLGGA